jgi:hypothetical protein
MENQILIRHQDGDIRREVRAAEILFRQEAGTWKVGLEIRTFEDLDLEEAVEDEDLIVVHLMDYPVGTEDPRRKERLEISIPEGFYTDTMARYTNLYLGEHFETDANRIAITRRSDTEYDVEWTCKSDDIDYYDVRAKENPIRICCSARVVDRITYPW